MSCPGDLLSGLVDGELDHGTRERVLSHLLACPPCSTEVQALRALKTRLSWAGAETPVPDDAFTARLLSMAVPGVEPVQRRAAGTIRPVSIRPRARAGAARPVTRRTRRRTVGGCLVALGLTTAFVLGGASGPSRPNQVNVDPTTDVFFADYVDVTTEVPMSQPVDAAVVGTSR
jgi:anti-sigma factor RsiW